MWICAYPAHVLRGYDTVGPHAVPQDGVPAIMESYTPEQAQVIQFDPDLSLADSIDDRYRKVYATTA